MILLGSDLDDLKKWAEKVIQQKANIYLATVTQEQQRQDSQAGFRSYISSWLFSKSQATSVASKDDEETKQYMDTIANVLFTSEQELEEESSEEFFDAKDEFP